MALVPKHILELSPYIAGERIEDIQKKLSLSKVIKLASNENPLGPSPKAIEAVEKSLLRSHLYPDTSSQKLRIKLAEKFGLKIENIVLGAGSEGIMSTIMRTFLRQGDEIIGAKNSFIGFRVLANASGQIVNWIPMKNYRYNLSAIANAVNDYTKIIYLANPDNPTGTYFNVDEFNYFMQSIPERVLVILDEAYFEYAKHIKDYPDSMHYRFDNVITLRTFSKVYGLAGLRVGYGFAHRNLISNLMKVKLPFEPSLPGQAAALAALSDYKYLKSTIESNLEEKKKLEIELENLNIKFLQSAANFITILFDDGNQAEMVCKELLSKGIIVRYLNNFGISNGIRITIGSKKENEYLITILKSTISKIYNI
tara:strand:+ start:3031 stop:4134 length:1104 start_codon:yes stop_codon:yes gene_type:complete